MMTMSVLEKYVVMLNDSTENCPLSASVHYQGRPIESMPPTIAGLFQHTKQAIYQSMATSQRLTFAGRQGGRNAVADWARLATSSGPAIHDPRSRKRTFRRERTCG